MLSEQQINNIPEALKQHPQWICWQAKPKGNGKMDKLPVNPKTGQVADANDRSIHVTFEDALNSAQSNHLSGIGFVFIEGGGLSGVDLDDCLNGSQLMPEQKRIVDRLCSYSEISPSSAIPFHSAVVASHNG